MEIFEGYLSKETTLKAEKIKITFEGTLIKNKSSLEVQGLCIPVTYKMILFIVILAVIGAAAVYLIPR